jgi:hypothetical protein
MPKLVCHCNIQVPFKLLAACRNRSGALPSVSEPGSWLYALSVFVHQAQQHGAIPVDGQVNKPSLALGQQLERAGLLQQLPAVITEAAHHLAELQDKPEVVAAGLAQSTSGYNTSKMSAAGWRLLAVYDNLQQLLALLVDTKALWPQEQLMSKVHQVNLIPLSQLFVRLLQQVSFCLSQLPDSLGMTTTVFIKVLVQAHCTMGFNFAPAADAIMSAAAEQQQRRQQQQALEAAQQELAQSPYVCQAARLLVVISSYLGMLQRQSAASTSGGSGPSSLSRWFRRSDASSSSSARGSLGVAAGHVPAVSRARRQSVMQG